MPLLVRRVPPTLDDVNNILRGGVRLPLPMRGDARIYGLHGLTLVFTTPAGTVTFSDASNAGLSAKQIAAEIKGDNSAVSVKIVDQVLYIEDADVSGPVVINKETSTAGPLLGFKNDVGGTITGKVYDAPGGTPPCLVSLSETGQMDGLILITEEA